MAKTSKIIQIEIRQHPNKTVVTFARPFGGGTEDIGLYVTKHYSFDRWETDRLFWLSIALHRLCSVEAVSIAPGYDNKGNACSFWGAYFKPKPDNNNILHDLGHKTNQITDLYTTTEGKDYIVCPDCHHHIPFSAWVYAHWDLAINVTCACSKKLIIKQGQLFK